MPECRDLARRAWLLLLAFPALAACSAFPQLIAHRDALTPQEHVQLGASYEAQGLQDDAGRQYEAALHQKKKYIPALIARGNLAFAGGDLQKAEADYRQVLRKAPGHPGANNNMAMILLARGKDLDQAERYVRIALKEDTPLRPYILETLASIYIREDRFPEALEALNEADSAASPDDVPLREQLAKTRGRLQR